MNCNMYNCYAVYSLMFTYFMYWINSTCMHAHVFTPLGIVFFLLCIENRPVHLWSVWTTSNNLKLKLVSIIQINKKQLFFIFLFIHFFVQYTGISFYTDFVVTNNTYLFSNFYKKYFTNTFVGAFLAYCNCIDK